MICKLQRKAAYLCTAVWIELLLIEIHTGFFAYAA